MRDISDTVGWHGGTRTPDLSVNSRVHLPTELHATWHWSERQESNLRHGAYETPVLPLNYAPVLRDVVSRDESADEANNDSTFEPRQFTFSCGRFHACDLESARVVVRFDFCLQPGDLPLKRDDQRTR